MTVTTVYSAAGNVVDSTAIIPPATLTTCHSVGASMGSRETLTYSVRVMPCEVWSRVVGYYRPVDNFNVGKRQEFNDRHMLSMDKRL